MLILLAAATTGCAGPATPLGAVWTTRISDAYASIQRPGGATSSEEKGVRISFNPTRQVLHEPKPMDVVIRDPAGIRKSYKLAITYDGLDVTRTFLRQARIAQRGDGQTLDIRLPVLRLSPEKDHLIELSYANTAGDAAYAQFEPPLCHAQNGIAVQHVEGFEPSLQLIQTIDKVSKEQGYSGAFTAALIAQESGFETRRVSWARAIGLTQIAPNAAEEISGINANWPRYPGINGLSATTLRIMVEAGEINDQNEWRLRPELSVRGGLAYVGKLEDRWSASENIARIHALFRDPEIERTKLVLASYNSGYARVSSALTRYGADWLHAPELKEARRYVNRIFSYCDSFSQGQHSGEIL